MFKLEALEPRVLLSADGASAGGGDDFDFAVQPLTALTANPPPAEQTENQLFQAVAQSDDSIAAVRVSSNIETGASLLSTSQDGREVTVASDRGARMVIIGSGHER